MVRRGYTVSSGYLLVLLPVVFQKSVDLRTSATLQWGLTAVFLSLVGMRQVPWVAIERLNPNPNPAPKPVHAVSFEGSGLMTPMCTPQPNPNPRAACPAVCVILLTFPFPPFSLVPQQLPFQRLVREIAQDFKTDLRFQGSAGFSLRAV